MNQDRYWTYLAQPAGLFEDNATAGDGARQPAVLVHTNRAHCVQQSVCSWGRALIWWRIGGGSLWVCRCAWFFVSLAISWCVTLSLYILNINKPVMCWNRIFLTFIYILLYFDSFVLIFGSYLYFLFNFSFLFINRFAMLIKITLAETPHYFRADKAHYYEASPWY